VVDYLLLDGLSTNTANNKEIRDCLSEINIEYCDWSDLTTSERHLYVATLYTIYMTHAINKKNLGNEQLNQTTPSEGLPANLPPSQTMQQSWNLQIPTTPQPQGNNLVHNVACLDQEFADL